MVWLQTHLLALGLFATLMTLCWLFVPKRTTFTSLMAFLAWSLIAYYGAEAERITTDGTRVDAAFPEGLQWFLVAIALLSALCFVLYRFGAYPPNERGADERIDSNPAYNE